jgi:two-component system, NarL family, response regulator DesR
MRGLRLLYVENDRALLGLMNNALSKHPKVESVEVASHSHDALELASQQRFDVALLDISLGAGSLTGVELGAELRSRFEHIGIVLLSQHITNDFLASLPKQFDYGWSTIQKSANLSIDYLVEVLETTAKGLNVIDPETRTASAETRVVEALTSRQHQIMALAASGLEGKEIANQLGLAAITVRQELSKIYRVLVPNPKPGTDLKTSAVLRYVRETRTGFSGV